MCLQLCNQKIILLYNDGLHAIKIYFPCLTITLTDNKMKIGISIDITNLDVSLKNLPEISNT